MRIPQIVFDDVTFKPGCAVPIVLESQKLVVARMVRESSDHEVAIRTLREDVIVAVRRDFGTLFRYWRLSEDTLPDDAPCGMVFIIADDELLPRDEHERKLYVPINTKLEAVASSAAQGKPGSLSTTGGVPDAEKRGEGRSSLPTVFN